jgi:2-C-methyl-D-erythritol 2,4-cyclodiphosphate synthase
MSHRIGQGIDIHPFAKGKKLILGGVEVPHTHGLEGHSDADALSHAVCDALLGALSLGDIGQHFSDRDPKNKGRSSSEFLEHASKLVSERGWKISNIDSTVITEEPMLRPHIESMRRKMAESLEISIDQISVKATRPEKLGALGRKEGLTAIAIALLESKS